VPAVGINAAINSRDFGTFRWQLNEQKLHPSAALWKGPRTSENWHFCDMPTDTENVCLSGVDRKWPTDCQDGAFDPELTSALISFEASRVLFLTRRPIVKC
jgi:hypothetical protein